MNSTELIWAWEDLMKMVFWVYLTGLCCLSDVKKKKKKVDKICNKKKLTKTQVSLFVSLFKGNFVDTI